MATTVITFSPGDPVYFSRILPVSLSFHCFGQDCSELVLVITVHLQRNLADSFATFLRLFIEDILCPVQFAVRTLCCPAFQEEENIPNVQLKHVAYLYDLAGMNLSYCPS